MNLAFSITSPNSPTPQLFMAAKRKRYAVPGSSVVIANLDRSGKLSDVNGSSSILKFHSSCGINPVTVCVRPLNIPTVCHLRPASADDLF